MNPIDSLPIEAIDLRADAYLPDGKIILSLGTKHSPQRQIYSLPVTALFGLTADVQRLHSGARAEVPASTGQPETTPSKEAVVKDQSKINVTVPKRWMIRSGLRERALIYVVLRDTH